MKNVRDGRASKTARGVALWVVYLGYDPLLAEILPPGAVETTDAVLRAGGRFPLLDWIKRPWVRALLALSERLTNPGLSAHLALRKRYFEDHVRTAAGVGATQLVVLGAGLDTLATRMLASGFPHGLEVDHPATQSVKASALREVFDGTSVPDFVGIDFSRSSLEEGLLAAEAYDPGAVSVVVAEGLLMYLLPLAVDALFRFVRDHTAPGSRLVFSFLEVDAKGRPIFGSLPSLSRLRLRMMGEPMTWGLPPRELGRFVDVRGLRLVDCPGIDELRARYLSRPEQAEIRLRIREHFAVAMKR